MAGGLNVGRYRWNLMPAPPPVARSGAEPDVHATVIPGIPPLVARVLFNRGIVGPSQLELFLAADRRLAADPFLLPDMHRAVERIFRALLSGENIAVYGDFDVDGVAGTAMLVQGLSMLGGRAIPYIPHRLTEGYGLRNAALESLYRQGVNLVVTVDHGVTAVRQVKRANRLGLDIIITDHHLPAEELPAAVAVVNPQRTDSSYPFRGLAGAGVAFKLLQALFQSLGKEERTEAFFDLVALGTVADMAPLLGENRYLVRQGLGLLNTAPRPGIGAMMSLTSNNRGQLDANSIAWVIAPRLNSAGRLDHAMPSYNLLMTESAAEAQEISAWLEARNTERQALTVRALDKARQDVIAQGIPPILVTSDEDYPAGVAGLVANRLREEFYRPAIVVRAGDVMSTGSCRSIAEFNMMDALGRCANLVTQYGGHAMAAGFSLPTRNIPLLKEALLQIGVDQLKDVDLRPRLDIDVEVTLLEVGNSFAVMEKLAPFGQGNPAPVFISRSVETIECHTMGRDAEHLKFKLKQDGVVWDGVGFGLGNCFGEMAARMDIVYSLERDRWNGGDRLRMNVLDFARLP